MKASEFYEKYIKIQTKDGLVSPHPLTDAEKEFLDNAAESNQKGVLFIRKRKRTLSIDVEYINKELNKLPKFFTPAIQPKLDKWGNIENEDNTTNQNPTT